MDERKEEILYRIVENFIKTGNPVGSEFLYNNYKWNIKSATIRREMAEMEKMGYLTHSYTSSGRVPTDEGYRFYVDRILNNKKILEEKRVEMERCKEKYDFSENQEVEEIIEKAVKLLVELTNYIVFISLPQPSLEVLRHIELVQLKPRKILSLIVTNTGFVYKKIIYVPEIITPNILERISCILNNKLSGLTFEKIMFSSLLEVEEEIVYQTNLFRKVTRELINQILAVHKEEIHCEGIEYILEQKEFKKIENIQKVLGIIFKKEFLYNYVKEILDKSLDEIKILIGKENKWEEMEDFSLILANYKLNPRNYGIIGILGPKRMAYPTAISGIKFISNILSETFSKISSGR